MKTLLCCAMVVGLGLTFSVNDAFGRGRSGQSGGPRGGGLVIDPGIQFTGPRLQTRITAACQQAGQSNHRS